MKLTDENWRPSYKKRSRRICKTCDNIKRKEYREANKSIVAAIQKRYQLNHPELYRNNSKQYRLKYPEKERERVKQYSIKHIGRVNAKEAKRRVLKSNKLIGNYNKEIEAIYTAANILQQSTGIKHHVDHIIPLNHPDVCGLHVPWNLQILTAEENVKKGNRL